MGAVLAASEHVGPAEGGLSQAVISTGDGRTTMISVRPDGGIVRNQVFTDVQGREVHFHVDPDGTKTETVSDNTHNTSTTTITGTDGGQTVVSRRVDEDNNTVINTTFPDGSTSG